MLTCYIWFDSCVTYPKYGYVKYSDAEKSQNIDDFL